MRAYLGVICIQSGSRYQVPVISQCVHVIMMTCFWTHTYFQWCTHSAKRQYNSVIFCLSDGGGGTIVVGYHWILITSFFMMFRQASSFSSLLSVNQDALHLNFKVRNNVRWLLCGWWVAMMSKIFCWIG